MGNLWSITEEIHSIRGSRNRTHSPLQPLTTHLLCQVVEHLVGHGDPLLIRCEAVLERAHVLSGAADIGLHGAQRLAVVLPVARHFLEDQRVLVGFPLQGIDPHGAAGKPNQSQCSYSHGR